MRVAASAEGATTRRAREQIGGGAAAQVGDGDLLIDVAPGIGDAGFAMHRIRLAAIAPLRPDQRNARTEPGVIVDMDLVRQAEIAAEGEQRMAVPDQMVQFEMVGTQALKQAPQCVRTPPEP